jgi:hypothetical protein
MKTELNSRHGRRSGYAMLLVMILLAVSLIVLGATLHRTSTTSSLTSRNNLYITSGSAAEAATEKAIALMMNDFQVDGDSRVSARLARYQTNVPTSTENPFWANFEFSDAQGNAGQTYVYRTDTNANTAFVDLQDQYAGLKGFCSNYRVISNVRPLNSAYTFTNAVQQDIQLSEIPIFQFAIFYNGLMEYTWCAPMTVRGRVHANGDIYVGSSADLSFNYTVTTTGKILSPAWDGHTPGEYSGKVTYSGTPAPGYSTGVPTMVLPIGTSNSPSAIHEIINPPPPGEDPNSPMSFQRYYNKAGMLILVSNTTVNVVLKIRGTDPSPRSVNWSNAMYFVSTTNSFYDEREGMSNRVTQIDVGKFITWCATNVDVGLKFGMSTGDKLNIIYVGDFRTPTTSRFNAVRLVNGATLPSVGFTVATANPLYIWGVYNCPISSYQNTTNTTASAPSSVVCDALTILSPAWNDIPSTSYPSGGHNPARTNTVNTAIIAGAVYSTGSSDTTFSGGVHNLPRLLEKWTNIRLTLNTSMVCLYNSFTVTRQFQSPGIYYTAPTRDFNFDQNFTSPDKLPPGTPGIRRLVRGSWCNPKPDSTNYNFAAFNGQ